MRCPANGMLMIANVVTVPLSGSSTNSSSCLPVAGSASRGGKYTFPSGAGAAAPAACPPRAHAGRRSREERRCAGSRCCSATTEHGHRVAVVGGLRGLLDRLCHIAQREVRDVGDRADGLVAPVHVHARAGADRVRGSRIDGVQQRGVRAVELDQRPGERSVQRLTLERFRLPRPRHDRADAGHRYDLGQSLIGDGVVLGGRNMHPAIRPAHPDDASLAQSGEELAEEWSY